MESVNNFSTLENLFTISERKILLEAFEYDRNLPKVKIVNIDKLLEAYNFWLKIPKEKCDVVKEIWTLSKSVQDIYDKLEYSKVEVNRFAQDEFGLPITIGSSCFAGLAAIYKSFQISNNGPTICLKHSQNVLRSQFRTIICKENMTCPSEEEYLKCFVHRQRITFFLTFELMQECSTKKINIGKLLEIFAQFFQICEDYLIVSDTENRYCEDYISEGSVCFPIVHALRSKTENSEIANLFYKKTTNAHLKKYLFELLQKNESMEYTKKILIQLRDEAKQELKNLDQNPLILKFIEDTFSDFIGNVETK